MNWINRKSLAVTLLLAPALLGSTGGCKKGLGNMRASIQTSMGIIKCNLYPDKMPKAVENFAGLAEGTKEWRDPKTGQSVKGKPLYNGTIFHRVIRDFMIQGGDPLGTGTGDPGYRINDEFSAGLNFDKPWVLAYANSGPNTNGSQFFITVKATPWLNQRGMTGYTILGDCSESKDVVLNISTVPTDKSTDRPLENVVIEKIEIAR